VAGPAGPGVSISTGTYVDHAGIARSMIASAPVREGQSLSLSYSAAPGELVLVHASLSQGFSPLAPFGYVGVLTLGPPAWTFPQGTMPAAGPLVVSVPIQELGPGLEGVVLYFQSSFVDASTSTAFAGGPSATVLLDSSL
jgi:hypothetical protein